jgi:hypothetical protein
MSRVVALAGFILCLITTSASAQLNSGGGGGGGGSVPTCPAGQFVNGPSACGLPTGVGGSRVEVSETSDFAPTSGATGTDYNNTGASGTITFTLPAWAAGLNYCFTDTAGHTVVVKAGSGNFITEVGVSSVSGGTITSMSQYSTVCIVAMTATGWQVDRHVGSWSLA